MSTSDPLPPLPWRRNLFFISGGVIIAGTAFSLAAPFLPLYLQELGVKENLAVWSGVSLAASAFSYSLMAPIWGTLADRHGKRVMLLRSGLGIAATYVLMALSRNQWQFLLFRVANGVLGGFIPASLMLVAANTPPDDLGFALGMVQTASSVGGIMGPMVGGTAAQFFGLRPALVFGAGLLCLAAGIGFFGAREEIPRREGGPGVVAGMRSCFGQRDLRTLFLIMLLTQTALMVVQPTLPLMIADLAGKNAALLTGVIFSLAGISTALGAPLLGRIKGIDYRGALWSGLIAASVLSGVQGLTSALWLLGLVRFLFGFANAGILVSGNVLIARYAPRDARGQVFGVLNGVSAIGSVVGPLLGGYIGQIWSPAGAFFVSGLIFLCCLPLLARGAGDSGAEIETGVTGDAKNSRDVKQ